MLSVLHYACRRIVTVILTLSEKPGLIVAEFGNLPLVGFFPAARPHTSACAVMQER